MATKVTQRSKGSPAANGAGGKRRPGRAGGNPGLDALLTDASSGGGLSRWLPGRAGLEVAAKLALRPRRVARRGLGLGAELGRITLGRSEVAPGKGDRRFKDPAWQGNPAYRRLLQAYLAAGQAVDGVLGDAELGWQSERRVRFAAENILDALAPTNFPALNPAVLKATLDHGGGNLVRGTRQFARDMARPPRIPSMVDSSAFTVGENLAVTPGAVVLRTPVFELIQYKPSTKRVRQEPLLITPPMINKFYITDLAPQRSMIEYLVGTGQQVFAISWRNPDAHQADWSLDTYAQALLEAMDACQKISGSERLHALGLCAGGIVLSATAAHLAANGEIDRLAGLSLGVCVLDNEHAGTASAFVDPASAALAVEESARRGYLDGRSLAGVFAWLRPNDLVWGYWVNNYLMGKDPPAFDILYWNADTTNLPAGLHRDFMELSLSNSLVRPGEMSVLGTPLDLSAITTDSYVVAGIADHITPWQSAYRTTALLGSSPRFVLSTSGHIAAMVNPPGNEKASFRVHDDNPPEAEAWLAAASQRPGTWWEDWAQWLSQRSGSERAAPRRLGVRGFTPLEPAPGSYVRQAAG